MEATTPCNYPHFRRVGYTFYGDVYVKMDFGNGAIFTIVSMEAFMFYNNIRENPAVWTTLEPKKPSWIEELIEQDQKERSEPPEFICDPTPPTEYVGEWLDNPIRARIECDICTHTWEAVFEEDAEKIECPHCENMANFDILED